MRRSTLFYHHVVNGPKVSHITFAIEPVMMPNDENKISHLLVGYSLCSHKDHFCRKTGRQVALEKDPVNVEIKELPKFIAEVIDTHDYYGYRNAGSAATRIFINSFCWLALKFF